MSILIARAHLRFVLAMLRTRNQIITNLYQSPYWKTEEEDYLYKMLDCSARWFHLDDPSEFNSFIRFIPSQLRRQFEKEFSVAQVKNQIQLFRNRFEAFLRYIKKIGAEFDEKQNVVHVDGNYWKLIGKVNILETK
ncbi:hypothetical protein DH2020_017240 [Rehmannia glutinosa]|uniref:Retrotransposon gag domain-containing protein n=1 Tax=Rehmannia glutinosa TaxID=99300 RepID=A0ABR0WUJ7_REHGL